jgi:hypothetical protein
MFRSYSAFCLCLLPLLSGCRSFDVRGNGQPATETRNLDGFVAIDGRGSFDTRVEQGETYSVRVNIDSNLLHVLRTRVEGTTLVVDSDESVSDILPGPHVTVTMPHFQSAELSGSGRIDVASCRETKPVSLVLSGSGDVTFNGAAPSVSARLEGSGDVDLAGSADQVDLYLGGSGSINASALPASTGSVRLSGSGGVSATINGRADVSLSGSGDIDLFGRVVLGQWSNSGSGDIHVH